MRKEWILITSELVARTIAEMDLDPTALADVEQALSDRACCDPQALYRH